MGSVTFLVCSSTSALREPGWKRGGRRDSPKVLKGRLQIFAFFIGGCQIITDAIVIRLGRENQRELGNRFFQSIVFEQLLPVRQRGLLNHLRDAIFFVSWINGPHLRQDFRRRTPRGGAYDTPEGPDLCQRIHH